MNKQFSTDLESRLKIRHSILYYAMLILLALPFLLPIVWLVVTSFKPAGQIYGETLSWLPNPPTLKNFSEAWGLLDFPRFIRNSFFVTSLSMLGTLASSSMVGYAFATLPARHKNLLFILMLATIMVPSTVTLIPLFVFFSKLGWVDTYLPLIVPHFFANAFYVFLFRQFYRSMPPHIFESAEIDGCSPLQTFWWIALPLSRPALATVAVFSFIAGWNDFINPLLYLNSTGKYTVSLGLSLFQGLFYTQLQYLMPMALVAMLPVLLLFILAQRFFVPAVAMNEMTE